MELTLRIGPEELTPELLDRLRPLLAGHTGLEITIRSLGNASLPHIPSAAALPPAYDRAEFEALRTELFGDGLG